MKAFKLMIATLLIGGTVMVTPSCKKYEDGPGFTLVPKKARWAGDWDLVETEDANGTITSDNSSDYVTFEKDGTFRSTSDNLTINGTWDFADDKEKLRVSFTFDNTTYTETSTILRLSTKELWLKDDSDNEISRFKAK